MRIEVITNDKITKYLAFMKDIYKDNIHYRDTMGSVIKMLLKGKAQICKSSTIIPVMVTDQGQIVAVSTFAIVDRMQDTLQICFFEALEHQEQAVDLIINYGKGLARERGINNILIGLDLHVNYGLGLLADHFDSTVSFGGSYNPPYYLDYFKKYASEEINLVSYLIDMKSFQFNLPQSLLERITSKYTVRKANLKNLKETIEIYTFLNNQAFKRHKFYYERRTEEDLELFQDFKLLLKDENLLFLEAEGEPVGFMLWYPDFNELINPGEKLGLKTLIKTKVFPEKIRRFKIVELGVIPKHQKRGGVLALLNKCHELVKGRYDLCESSWILEENMASRGLGIRWADQEYKHYKVFIVNL